MFCPFCAAEDTKVTDSRLVTDGSQVRRRRECLKCNERFTTYEKIEFALPQIIKRDNTRVPFDEKKLLNSFQVALRKRPISHDTIERAINTVKKWLRESGEREVRSERIGEMVMQILHQLDQIAYVRYASVYRCFEDVSDFHEEIAKIQKHEAVVEE